MPPEAEALLALTAMHGHSGQPAALSPQCQGLTDRHGHGPEDGQKTGQLLQRHHLQQQTYHPVRTGPPQGELELISQLSMFHHQIKHSVQTLF